MAINSFRDLLVWQKSIDLVELVYSFTASFPSEEKFGLTSQLRRSAVSIPSNIAEGFGRKGKNEFRQFIRIAYGSCLEIETQIEIALRVEILSKKDYDSVMQVLVEVKKMLNKLSASLQH